LVALTRLDRPIGIYLLMWPMLWAFWIAANGIPHLPTLLIFIIGTVLTRSAGCAINDYADRDFDGHVERTAHRPLASGTLTGGDALATTAILMGLAFLLVLLTNKLTVMLSVVAVLLAMIYPYCKRYTHFPQVVLGAAFAWAVPMAFAAQTGSVPASGWWLFLSAVVWATAYDTLYAMADRADDLKIGIKSTAVFLGRYDLLAVAILHAIVILLLAYTGMVNERSWIFFLGLVCGCALIAHQLWISRYRDPHACLRAFLNNNWLGMCIFIALATDYLIYP